jgi:hypothetical protein
MKKWKVASHILVRDAVLISHPRSGLTWLRYIFFELRKTAWPKTIKRPATELCNPVVRMAHGGMGWHLPAKRSAQRGYKHQGQPKKFKKCLFLLRDPRDVLVSNFYCLDREETIGEFFRDRFLGIDALCRWLCTWDDHLREFDSSLVARYEDRVKDAFEQTKIILEFLGLEASDDHIRAALDESSFEKLREKEMTVGLSQDLRPPTPGKPHTAMVRRGVPGGWKDELDEATEEYAWEHMQALPERFWYER